MAEPVGIVELVDVCAREQARSLDLFEHLGAWVASTEHPPLQQLFARAAHRHAWHAGLWADRSPTIPVAAATSGTAAISEAADDTDRWAAYATALGLLTGSLDALRHRVDPVLDPGTARVLDLVGADAREIADALANARP